MGILFMLQHEVNLLAGKPAPETTVIWGGGGKPRSLTTAYLLFTTHKRKEELCGSMNVSLCVRRLQEPILTGPDFLRPNTFIINKHVRSLLKMRSGITNEIGEGAWGVAKPSKH